MYNTAYNRVCTATPERRRSDRFLRSRRSRRGKNNTRFGGTRVVRNAIGIWNDIARDARERPPIARVSGHPFVRTAFAPDTRRRTGRTDCRVPANKVLDTRDVSLCVWRSSVWCARKQSAAVNERNVSTRPMFSRPHKLRCE